MSRLHLVRASTRLALLAVALSACGSDATSPQPIVAPPAGTVITAANGAVQLTFPQGAVNVPLSLSVSPRTVTRRGGQSVRGTTYDFSPTGTTFNKPVQLTIKYRPDDVSSPSSPRIELGYLEGDSVWRRIPSRVDAAKYTVSASINHFSTYAILNVVAVPRPCLGRCPGNPQ
jgi:hypothetical protein